MLIHVIHAYKTWLGDCNLAELGILYDLLFTSI